MVSLVILGFAATGAGLPGVQIAQRFQLLVEAGLFHLRFNFRARKALAEQLGAVGDAPGGERGEHGVQFQFAHVDFIERVRSGVVVRQVVGLFLIGDECGHAFEEKIEIVGAEGSIISVIVGAPGFERLEDFAQSTFGVAAAAKGMAVPRPMPASKVIIARTLSSSARCAFKYSNEPMVPCSSPLKRTKRMVRRGRSPVALMARAASMTSAALQPLSSAPVPNSQESRCAPRMTASSGFS